MDELEKEFFKAMVGFDYRESDGDILVEQIDDAKAAASLCREKCKQAIDDFIKTFPEKDLQSNNLFNPKDHGTK